MIYNYLIYKLVCNLADSKQGAYYVQLSNNYLTLRGLSGSLLRWAQWVARLEGSGYPK